MVLSFIVMDHNGQKTIFIWLSNSAPTSTLCWFSSIKSAWYPDSSLPIFCQNG